MRKKIVFLLFVSLFLSFIGCDKSPNDENTQNKDLIALPVGVPLYSEVLEYLASCEYDEIDASDISESLREVIEENITPEYLNYSVFFDENNSRYITPICYDDSLSLQYAIGVCDKHYSEHVDVSGNRYITCSQTGNTCHIEVSVLPGGEEIAVFIVTCSENMAQ